jgi:hypothetical protein
MAAAAAAAAATAAAATTTTSHQNTMEELPSSSSPANDYGACNNNNGATTSENPQQQQSSDDELVASTQLSKEVLLVWRKPWMTALVLFFVFYILWANGVVITRYWIKEDWDFALPGLGERCVCGFLFCFDPNNHETSKQGSCCVACYIVAIVAHHTKVFLISHPCCDPNYLFVCVFLYFSCSALRKLSMRSHMTFGAIAILCSPIQMIMPFTSGWKKGTTSMTRNWYRTIHRYTGRVYVMCAITSFFWGQWFICLKEFVLVGGYNMGVSFSFAGFFIAYFAYMTWKTAPGKNNNSNTNTNGTRYTVEDHRNYAIRSFSQIIAPVLYRYWYLLLTILNVYRTPYLNGGDASKGENLVCNDRNVCHDYLRPFDAIYAWLYWISAWVVAEIIIACLPRHATVTEQTIDSVSVLGDDGIEVPLLENHLQQPPTMDDESEDINTTESDNNIQEENPSPARAIANDKDDRLVTTSVVNFVGCLLAVLSTMVTGPILYAMVTSMIKKSERPSLA